MPMKIACFFFFPFFLYIFPTCSKTGSY